MYPTRRFGSHSDSSDNPSMKIEKKSSSVSVKTSEKPVEFQTATVYYSKSISSNYSNKDSVKKMSKVGNIVSLYDDDDDDDFEVIDNTPQSIIDARKVVMQPTVYITHPKSESKFGKKSSFRSYHTSDDITGYDDSENSMTDEGSWDSTYNPFNQTNVSDSSHRYESGNKFSGWNSEERLGW